LPLYLVHMNTDTLILPNFPVVDALSAGERARAILALVHEHGFQSIETLATLFSVTTQTIRRDVNMLCDQGLGRRRHGGIDVLPEGDNLAYPARRILDRDAKRRIARRVSDQVPDGASLFFGIGTTRLHCAQALVDRQHLRVMTNNLHVALTLGRNPTCELTIAGGRLRYLDFDVVAGEAHGFFRRFSVDIGIYGTGGVADDGSLLDFNQDEVRMRSELAAHCRQRFLVLDHSKFGRGATVRGGHITEASVVFTDRPVPDPIAEMLHHAKVSLVIAPPDTLPTP
jgi:DeoR family glycerol-3-phosphate regulon repressor